MTTPTEHPDPTPAQRWEAEQQNWQQLLLSYADASAQDEQFLTHIGNAMRGSLLAGKPYPGSTNDSKKDQVDSAMSSDEVVFALRRLEGRVSELIQTVDVLINRGAASPPEVN